MQDHGQRKGEKKSTANICRKAEFSHEMIGTGTSRQEILTRNPFHDQVWSRCWQAFPRRPFNSLSNSHLVIYFLKQKKKALVIESCKKFAIRVVNAGGLDCLSRGNLIPLHTPLLVIRQGGKHMLSRELPFPGCSASRILPHATLSKREKSPLQCSANEPSFSNDRKLEQSS
jgi:hypothetical protein